MSSSLGEKLRQAREERGISISEVAEQTRISPQYIKAIEVDDYKPLPGGIFNKGFVRSYARYVGFDENEALNDYAELMAANDMATEAEQKVYHQEVMTGDDSFRSFIPTIAFALVVLIMLIGGIALLINYLANRPASAPPVNANTNSNVNANSASSPEAATPENPTGSPVMGTVRIEFSTKGEEVSLNTILDGEQMNPSVIAGKPVLFTPKESLRIKYSKYRAPSLEMAINGKAISLPRSPANPAREHIEFELTKDNLVRIWQGGEIKFTPVVQATPAPRPRPSPKPNTATPAPRPSLPPVNAPMTRRTP
jgi:cytoskeletal protein RodZ